MTRAHILHEIQRTAKENDGKPLGQMKFTSETGIKESEWFGVYWARWSDAIKEAGLTPNSFRLAYDKTVLLIKYAQLAAELGRLPAKGDLRLRANRDKTFPSDKTLDRLGTKSELVRQLAAYCQSHPDFEDVMRLCKEYSSRAPKTSIDEEQEDTGEVELGFVYLVKSGRFYKIGRSNHAGRRTYELDLQLPEKATPVHVIRTDDPVGIEAYWHARFGSKRKNGEWFNLDANDVAAFRRRKTM